jgi:hypothetical protein
VTTRVAVYVTGRTTFHWILIYSRLR